jgi:phosphate starvation-inducible PhoH-like protein
MSKKPRRRDENPELVAEIYENINKNAVLNYEIKTPFQFNDKHKEFLQLLQTNKTKMVFVDGPAGTAKTYIAVLAGLHLLKEHYIDQIYYIRSIVESASKQMGSLPGEVNDKFLPWSMPLIEKITEISSKSTADNLYKSEMIKGIPVNYCRGLTFNRSLVIVDEAQNLSKEELTTILTRFGHKSKYVIVGDTFQTDIRNSGFKDVLNAFNTQFSKDNEIYCLKFGLSEIVRSEILKHIVKVLESIPKHHPQFVPENKPL